LNFLTFGMFYHAEHHLFPAVPTRHLGELAARIDAAGAPEFFEVTDFTRE
jgi:fatty acid desaturase